jgi:hypothetical protein
MGTNETKDTTTEPAHRFIPPAVLLGALTWTFIDFTKIMAGCQPTKHTTKREIVAFYQLIIFLSLFLFGSGFWISEFFGLGFVEYLSSL